MKELLIKVRDYIKTEEGFCGLCATVWEMCGDDKITKEEYGELKKWLNDVRESKGKMHADYFWKTGFKSPRIVFLNKEIKKLS